MRQVLPLRHSAKQLRCRHQSHQPQVSTSVLRWRSLPKGDRIAWIDPIPTGRSGEYISVMTRRITPTE